jgi:hypothetical protein
VRSLGTSSLTDMYILHRPGCSYDDELTRPCYPNQRFLLTPGGGGRRGILPLPPEEASVDEASKLSSVTDLVCPGIEIEKVCPSLRL